MITMIFLLFPLFTIGLTVWIIKRIIKNNDVGRTSAISSFLFTILMLAPFAVSKICVNLCPGWPLPGQSIYGGSTVSSVMTFLSVLPLIFFILSLIFSIASLKKENKRTATGLIVLNVLVLFQIMVYDALMAMSHML